MDLSWRERYLYRLTRRGSNTDGKEGNQNIYINNNNPDVADNSYITDIYCQN